MILVLDNGVNGEVCSQEIRMLRVGEAKIWPVASAQMSKIR